MLLPGLFIGRCPSDVAIAKFRSRRGSRELASYPDVEATKKVLSLPCDATDSEIAALFPQGYGLNRGERVVGHGEEVETRTNEHDELSPLSTWDHSLRVVVLTPALCLSPLTLSFPSLRPKKKKKRRFVWCRKLSCPVRRSSSAGVNFTFQSYEMPPQQRWHRLSSLSRPCHGCGC